MKLRIITFFLYIANAFTIQYLISFGRGERADYIKLPLICIVFFLAGATIEYFEKRINFNAFLFLMISLGISFFPVFSVKGYMIVWTIELLIALPSFFLGFFITRLTTSNKLITLSLLSLFTFFVSFILSPLIAYKKMISLYSKKELYGTPIHFKYIDSGGVTWINEMYTNKVVLLEYYFAACTPCNLKMRQLQKLAEHYQNNKDVVILTVDAGDIDLFEKFKSQSSVLPTSMQHVYDSASAIGNQLKIESYPTEFLIDRKGLIRSELVGYGKDVSLIYAKETIKKINVLLNEK